MLKQWWLLDWVGWGDWAPMLFLILVLFNLLLLPFQLLLCFSTIFTFWYILVKDSSVAIFIGDIFCHQNKILSVLTKEIFADKTLFNILLRHAFISFFFCFLFFVVVVFCLFFCEKYCYSIFLYFSLQHGFLSSFVHISRGILLKLLSLNFIILFNIWQVKKLKFLVHVWVSNIFSNISNHLTFSVINFVLELIGSDIRI